MEAEPTKSRTSDDAALSVSLKKKTESAAGGELLMIFEKLYLKLF